MVALHLLDSLAMHPFVRDIGSLADLGSGAGLPGIPLAIAVPALRVTLVESNGKKARFLREAVRTLGLDNAQVAESRAQALRSEERTSELQSLMRISYSVFCLKRKIHTMHKSKQ